MPTVSVENRSRSTYILLMIGDVIKGGMQTRTVRHDTVLGPEQRINLDVFCVEASRWEGAAGFSSAKLQAPQSIKGEMRRGGSQSNVWSRVAENNASLGTENATHSLEMAVKSPLVERKLDAVRKRIVPEVPIGTVGFIFVHGGRPVGASFLAARPSPAPSFRNCLTPTRWTIYYVRHPQAAAARPTTGPPRTSSSGFAVPAASAKTGGSGAGIRTDADGLLGDGVSLDATLVHFGVQVARKVEPQPRRPMLNQDD